MSTGDVVSEFPDSPEPGLCLFVHCKWVPGIPERLPESSEAELCSLLACDGERCWEGILKRGDLASSLGDSWTQSSNLSLLQGAFSRSRRNICADSGAHRAQAVWSLPREAAGNARHLELSVRFVYPEGPIVAVRGVQLPSAGLDRGIARFFDMAHNAQAAANARLTAAAQESAELAQRRELVQQQLEAVPEQLKAEEERLLHEFAGVLNAQKRRCRTLWEAEQRAKGAQVEEIGVPVHVHQSPVKPSLKDCLDRHEPPAVNMGLGKEPGPTPGTLDFLGGSMLASQAQDPSTFTFTIPLTLGMGTCASSALPSGPSPKFPGSQRLPTVPSVPSMVRETVPKVAQPVAIKQEVQSETRVRNPAFGRGKRELLEPEASLSQKRYR